MTEKEFHTIINEYSDTMFRFAFFKTGNEELAKDVVQESFINLWKENKVLKEYKNIQAYCFTLIKNKSIDHFRSNENRLKVVKSLHQEHELDNTIEEKLEREEKLKKMFYYLNKLEEKHATILRLRDFEGYTYAEIAELIGMSLENVKVTLFRARKALQNILQEENETRNVTY